MLTGSRYVARMWRNPHYCPDLESELPRYLVLPEALGSTNGIVRTDFSLESACSPS
jgi:hypothetical protein